MQKVEPLYFALGTKNGNELGRFLGKASCNPSPAVKSGEYGHHCVGMHVCVLVCMSQA